MLATSYFFRWERPAVAGEDQLGILVVITRSCKARLTLAAILDILLLQSWAS